MKKKRTSKLYIRDILDSIKSIQEYTHGLTFKEFRSKKIVIDSVVRNFEIMGEASKNVPDEIRSLHSEIPWKQISGMRNKIIHEYFGVDLDIVWKTIKRRLAGLEASLKKIYYKRKKKQKRSVT